MLSCGLVRAIPRWSSIAFLVTSLCACRSGIDRTRDLERAPLQVGVTTKSEIVDAIGLPRRVDKDAASGTETWYYTGKAQSRSYVVYVPFAITQVSASTQLVHLIDIGAKNVVDDQPVLLTCVFSPDGRLVQIHRKENP
jgi:hypothetical protein